MVQAADMVDLDDTAAIHGMDIPVFGTIHPEGLMNSPAMVVIEVAAQDLPQMPLIQDDHMVEAFSTDTPDQSFDERILPRTSWCGNHLLDAHVLDALLEVPTIDTVTISQKVSGCFIPWESIDDLLGSPLGSWIRGDVEMQDAPSVMSQDQEDEEDLIPHGWYDEEVDGRDVSDVILQEALPGLRRRLPLTDHVFRNRRLVEFDPDLSQLADNVWSTPERIGERHTPDEVADFLRGCWPPRLPGARELRPVLAELAPTPCDDGFGSNDHERLTPAGPGPREPGPEDAIVSPYQWSLTGSTIDSQLMPQGQVLDLQGCS